MVLHFGIIPDDEISQLLNIVIERIYIQLFQKAVNLCF